MWFLSFFCIHRWKQVSNIKWTIYNTGKNHEPFLYSVYCVRLLKRKTWVCVLCTCHVFQSSIKWNERCAAQMCSCTKHYKFSLSKSNRISNRRNIRMYICSVCVCIGVTRMNLGKVDEHHSCKFYGFAFLLGKRWNKRKEKKERKKKNIRH